MRFALFPAIFALVVGTTPQAAQDNNVAWAKTWDAAVREAKIRNVPIFFTAHKDG